jgi:hypothetical protein
MFPIGPHGHQTLRCWVKKRRLSEQLSKCRFFGNFYDRPNTMEDGETNEEGQDDSN